MSLTAKRNVDQRLAEPAPDRGRRQRDAKPVNLLLLGLLSPRGWKQTGEHREYGGNQTGFAIHTTRCLSAYNRCYCRPSERRRRSISPTSSGGMCPAPWQVLQLFRLP